MKRILRVIFTFVLTIFFYSANSQTAFYAVINGNWQASGTWSLDGLTPILCSPCTAGTHYPGPNDDAYTNGFTVGITPGPNANCRDLYVDDSTPSGIQFNAPSSILTINGTLYSYSELFDFPNPPQVGNLVTGGGRMIFTGSNLGNELGGLTNGDEIIIYWNSLAPLPRVEFNLGTNTRRIGDIWLSDFSANDNLTVITSFLVSSGTLNIDEFTVTGLNVSSASSQLTVASGATLNLPVPATQTGLPNSKITTVSISGTLNLSSSTSYINAATLTMSAGGNLNINFDDPSTQTEGWWHTTNGPTTSTINTNSTITYQSTSDQNVFARTYGNLVLDGGGTKTVPNNTALVINGSLTINSPSVNFNTTSATGISIGGSLVNDGLWSPAQLVTFNSAAPGSIGGSQSTTFGGGITINKPGGVLTMATATSINTNISNGITISSGTLNLGDVNTTLTGGNVSNSGMLISGTSGTLRIQGTSQLAGTGSYSLQNLEVLSTGACTFGTNVAFGGDILNNGSLAFSNSIDVTFNGTGLQTISGNAFSIYDMIVDKFSSTVWNNGNINLLGTLTVTNGTLAVNGSGSGLFILNSDANGDARIGPMGGGSITGNVTFERYFNNTVDNRYRNFAFPVNGVTVEQLENFFTIVDGSFAWYQESVLGDYDQGWQIQNAGALANGRAYTAAMYNIQPITISVTGPLLKSLPTNAQSPHNYGLTYTDDPAQDASQDGWNFVANPFASPIDWTSAAGWTKIGGIDANAAIWDAVLGAYRYTGGTWDGVVASGQSFWVHTTSSATLESTEEVKVNVADPIFYRKKTLDHKDRLLVKLEDDNAFDVAVIQYIEKATPEYDGAFDAYKLPNRIFNLSSLTPEGANLAVNALPRSFCTNNFRLNLTNIDPGSYKLSFENLTSFDNLDSLTLYDKFLDKSVRVSEGSIYNFDVTSDASSYGAERFELLFAYPDVAGFTPEISLDNRKLVSNFESGNQWILNGEIIPEETDNVLLPMASGEYQVLVSDGTCSVKSDAFKLDRIASRIHPNPATTHFIIDLTDASKDNPPKSGFIYLYSVTGQLILKERFTATDTELSVKVDGIAAGEYVVNLVVGDSKIVAKERLIIK